MNYYMKVCIYVDDYYTNDLLMNYYMNAYVELTWWISMRLWYWCCTLLLMLYVVVDVVIVVEVVRCCWYCCCDVVVIVVDVVRCCWLSCWVHVYSYKVGGLCPVNVNHSNTLFLGVYTPVLTLRSYLIQF